MRLRLGRSDGDGCGKQKEASCLYKLFNGDNYAVCSCHHKSGRILFILDPLDILVFHVYLQCFPPLMMLLCETVRFFLK